MTDILVPFLIAIAVPIFNRWLAHRYPAPQLSAKGPSLEELRPKYQKWEWASLPIYLSLMFLVSGAIYAPLHFVNRWRAASMQSTPDTFVFFLDGPTLWIPAFFMGIVLAGVVMTVFLRAILKNRFAEFDRYVALRYGFDQHRVTKVLTTAISFGFVIAVLALFDVRVVAAPEKLRVNTLFGLERSYEYNEISEVVTAPALVAPNGNVVHRRIYVLRFNDGTSYSTNYMPEYELSNRPVSQFIETVLRRSGLTAREKELFQRGEF